MHMHARMHGGRGTVEPPPPKRPCTYVCMHACMYACMAGARRSEWSPEKGMYGTCMYGTCLYVICMSTGEGRSSEESRRVKKAVE